MASESVKILSKTYDHLTPSTSTLDQKFLRHIQAVEKEYKLLFSSKPDQVRVEQWLRKMAEAPRSQDSAILKNRNKYAKLLKMCVLDLKRLEGIFKKMPPSDGDNELRPIQHHEILDIEHFATQTKKRQKSLQRAKEKFNFLTQKAKDEMDERRKRQGRQVVADLKTRNFKDYFSQGSSLLSSPAHSKGVLKRNFSPLNTVTSQKMKHLLSTSQLKLNENKANKTCDNPIILKSYVRSPLTK